MDLRPVASTYQALQESARVDQPNEVYEELSYEIPNEQAVWKNRRAYCTFRTSPSASGAVTWQQELLRVGELLGCNPFTPKFKKYILPTL